MAIGEIVTKLLGRGSSVEIKLFECADCEATFESAKQPKRASCPECLSSEVTTVQTTDSHT